MNKKEAALNISHLAERLFQGYFTYVTAIHVATDDRVESLVPPILPGQIVPIGIIKGKHGGHHEFDFKYYLGLAKSDELIVSQLDIIWFSGSLLLIGDELSKQNYFDRAPILELIRHLRNGIAHGNRFKIDNLSSLIRFPANNHSGSTDKKEKFEITAALNDRTVLFDFMQAIEIHNLLRAVSNYLSNYAS